MQGSSSQDRDWGEWTSLTGYETGDGDGTHQLWIQRMRSLGPEAKSGGAGKHAKSPKKASVHLLSHLDSAGLVLQTAAG